MGYICWFPKVRVPPNHAFSRDFPYKPTLWPLKVENICEKKHLVLKGFFYWGFHKWSYPKMLGFQGTIPLKCVKYPLNV